MRPISEIADQDLVWVQPARSKQAFELQAASEVVATVQFDRTSLASAETAGHQWTFKRVGFWHPQVTIREPGSDANVAVFKPGWTGGGVLELPEGRVLRLGAANFWHSQWDWIDPDSKAIVRFKSHPGLLRMEGRVDIEPEAAGLSELPLLVALGWYLLVLFARDSAAAAATSSVVVAASAH